MPQFVKMGLNGTGYLGKQESYTRALRRRASRRRVKPGFPITTPFNSIEDVKQYLSGDTMICLLCGKNYKLIGTHLKRIHGVTVDEYKKRYNIPWTYGLICEDSSKNYSKAIKKRMENGWVPPIKTGEEHKKMISADKRKCVFKADVSKSNLGVYCKPIHPLRQAPDGTMETFTRWRKRTALKIGTEEFKENMRNRPQCQPEKIKERGFNKFWKGKKQSEDHIKKRFSKYNRPETGHSSNIKIS